MFPSDNIAMALGETPITKNKVYASGEAADMNIQVFEYIKEQIEYLKQEVSKEVPLNKDSQYQPEAAAKIYELKYLERQQIMKLLDRLFDVEVVKE